MYLFVTFILQNFKKILRARAMRMCYFWAQNCPFVLNKIYLVQTIIMFWKIINTILIYLLAPFIVQNFKNIVQADPQLWGCTIFEPKMAHFPKSHP